jgi:hypothetical protein
MPRFLGYNAHQFCNRSRWLLGQHQRVPIHSEFVLVTRAHAEGGRLPGGAAISVHCAPSAPDAESQSHRPGQLSWKTNRPVTMLYAASTFAGILFLVIHWSYSGICISFWIWSNVLPALTIAPTRSTSNA